MNVPRVKKYNINAAGGAVGFSSGSAEPASLICCSDYAMRTESPSVGGAGIRSAGRN